MALKRVTMQDIADACGLSRNTVSKVFNGRGIVPESTQKMVLAKAQELGYHQLPSGSNRNAREAQGSIALLTQHKLLNHGFGSVFMTSFTDQLSRAGFSLKIFEISPQELAARQLPPRLDLEDTIGFLGIELFDKQYLDLICSLNKPTVFVDAHAHACRDLLSCDVISMENVGNEHLLVTRMIKAGAKRIGFVGDIEHCNSFYERWVGYFLALRDAGLKIDQSFCILAEDSEDYDTIGGYLTSILGRIPEEDETVELDAMGYHFKILSITDHHLDEIEATRLKPDQTVENSDRTEEN